MKHFPDLEPYSNLRPLPGEEHVVEYDDEFHCWAEFGADSGFCYQQFSERPEQ